MSISRFLVENLLHLVYDSQPAENLTPNDTSSSLWKGEDDNASNMELDEEGNPSIDALVESDQAQPSNASTTASTTRDEEKDIDKK